MQPFVPLSVRPAAPIVTAPPPQRTVLVTLPPQKSTPPLPLVLMLTLVGLHGEFIIVEWCEALLALAVVIAVVG